MNLLYKRGNEIIFRKFKEENILYLRGYNIKTFFLVMLMFVLVSFAYLSRISLQSYGQSNTVVFGSNMPGGYVVKGKSTLSTLTFAKGDPEQRIFNGNGELLFCLDPFIAASQGNKDVKDIIGYHGVTEEDVNKMAAGVDYIQNEYKGADEGERELLAQYYIWHYMNGKATYEFNEFKPKGISESIMNDSLKQAGDYAEKVKDKVKGRGLLYTDNGTQPLVRFSLEKYGKFNIKKVSKFNSKIVEMFPENYSLKGAVYGIYSDNKCLNLVEELVTDEFGKTQSLDIKAGRYYVKEITAPKGFLLDSEVYEADVKSGLSFEFQGKDEPYLDNLKFKLFKRAEEGSDKNLELKGAEYKVNYYSKENANPDKDHPYRTWHFATDSNGKIVFDQEHQVAGDKLFIDDRGNPVLPIGTITVEEIKAPKGFARDIGIISKQNISCENSSVGMSLLKDINHVEKSQKVNISIIKKDSETLKNRPQGKGLLKGAIYEIFRFDPYSEKDIFVGEIVTDDNGYGKLEGLKPALYTIKEKVPSKGYNLDKTVHQIKARIEGVNEESFNYEVESLEKPITLRVLKTSFDENGVKVNLKGAKMALKDEVGNIIEIWMSEEEPKLFKGLQKGTYIVEELEAPKGYFKMENPIRFNVEEVESIQDVEVFNEQIPDIKTQAISEAGGKIVDARERVKVIDRVQYKNLIIGKKYTIDGKLVEKDDSNKIVASNKVDFIPSNTSGFVEVPFEFDGSILNGKSLVAFENLYRDRKLLVSHMDINDEGQTVKVENVITKTPRTGDESETSLYLALSFMSLGIVLIMVGVKNCKLK